MSRVHTSVLIATVAFAVSAAAIPNLTAAAEQLSRHVYVTVIDNSGAAVTGLTAADFRLRENNRDREIASVEPATEPLRIALMVEETLTPMGGVRQGLADFIQQMRGKAEMSIIVVGLANRAGHKITFGRFLKFGLPTMLLTLVISHVYVLLRYY